MNKKVLLGLTAISIAGAGAYTLRPSRGPLPQPAAVGAPAASPASEPAALPGQSQAPEPAPAPEAPPLEIQAWLGRVQGPVYLKLAVRPGREFTPAQADAPLAPGDIVLTGIAGKAEVVLDGSSVILLGPNSAFVVGSLDAGRTEFTLGLGSLVAKIRKLLERDEMRFRGLTAVASVRGTELGLVVDRARGRAVAGVFREGAVSVASEAGETSLGPGQETSVQGSGAPAPAGPLKSLKPLEARMAEARRRLAARASWKARTPDELESSRRKLEERRTVAPDKVQGLEGVLKSAGGRKADKDPLAALRQKLRQDVQKKMDRERDMQSVRDKLRDDVRRKQQGGSKP